jgi:hypothetical protein
MFKPFKGKVKGYVVNADVAKAVTAVAGIATSPMKMLLPAVVFAAPLLAQKRTTVALDVPEAVAPLVEDKRHITWSIRAPSAPAVKTSAKAVPAASVPSNALVLVIAVLTMAFSAPTLGVCVNTGVAVTAMIKILQN